MDKKSSDFLDARLGSILTGVVINLVAGAVILLLAKICLPEQITSWKIWLSLLISVLAVGTVIWLGVDQRMELKAMQAAQREIKELAKEIGEQSAGALKFRDQLEAQIEGLGRRIDEVAGEMSVLAKVRESDAAALRRQLIEKIDVLGTRIDEASATMTSSLNALEEAKMHEGAAARKQMLDQVAVVGKRIDELKAATGPAVETVKQGLARLGQELAALKKAVEGTRPAPAAPAATGELPRIIPAPPVPGTPKPPPTAP